MKEGNQYYNAKRFDEAVDSYKKVIELDPTYKEALFNLGLAYVQLYQPGSTHEKDIGYSQGAIKAFKDYLALEPTSEKVKNYLIEICQKSGNNEEAIAFFTSEHERNPSDVRTIALIANLYTKSNDIDKAIEWLQKRIDLEPTNPEAYYTMGVNCWARSYNHMDLSVEDRFKILDKGIAALDKALELKNEYFEAYAYKNLILRQKAAFDPNPDQRLAYTQEADKYQKMAMEIQNRLKQQADQAEAKAGG
jgi:tetratricopeptide (TPR) repeat protein